MASLPQTSTPLDFVMEHFAVFDDETVVVAALGGSANHERLDLFAEQPHRLHIERGELMIRIGHLDHEIFADALSSGASTYVPSVRTTRTVAPFLQFLEPRIVGLQCTRSAGRIGQHEGALRLNGFGAGMGSVRRTMPSSKTKMNEMPLALLQDFSSVDAIRFLHLFELEKRVCCSKHAASMRPQLWGGRKTAIDTFFARRKCLSSSAHAFAAWWSLGENCFCSSSELVFERLRFGLFIVELGRASSKTRNDVASAAHRPWGFCDRESPSTLFQTPV